MSWFYQIDDALWRLWCYATSGRTLAIVFGIGFAMLAISLLVLSRTRWGHSKPLAKCVVLSVLAHVWLLMYALGNRTVLPQGDPRGSQQSLAVSFEEFDPSTSTASEVARLAAEETPAAVASESPLPWEAPANLADLPQPAELTALESLADLAPPPLLPVLDPTPLPTLPPPEELADILRDGDPASEEQPTEAQAQAPSLIQKTTQVPSPVLPPELASPPTESLEQELADSSQVPTSGEPSLSNPVQMQPIVNSRRPSMRG